MPFSTKPNVVILSDTTLTDLIAGQGSKSIYVSSLAVSNTSGQLTRIDIFEGASLLLSMALAANGGGFVMKFEPVWGLATAQSLKAQLSTGVADVRVNTHGYVS